MKQAYEKLHFAKSEHEYTKFYRSILGIYFTHISYRKASYKNSQTLRKYLYQFTDEYLTEPLILNMYWINAVCFEIWLHNATECKQGRQTVFQTKTLWNAAPNARASDWVEQEIWR